MNKTPVKEHLTKLASTSDALLSAPIKTFSDFEDRMLDAVCELHQNDSCRREVAKRIS